MAVAVLLIALAWWAVLRTGSLDTVSVAADSTAESPAKRMNAPARSEVIAVPERPAPARSVLTPASISLRDEIRDAPDLKALYDRMKDVRDPTGERSYRLAEAIFECSAFIDLPMEQLSAKLAIRKDARDNPRRNQVLATMVKRCAGFAGMGARFHEIYQELHARAEAAGYPAEIARALRAEASNPDLERADATAMKLLASNPEPEVLFEISQYLGLRNRGVPPGNIDGQTRAIAWGLVECEYGADCGPQSRSLMMTCILMGACELTRVEEAVMAQGASQSTINAAARLRDQLIQRIANRDWAGLGFVERNKSP